MFENCHVSKIFPSPHVFGRNSADVDQIKSRVLEDERRDGEDLQDFKKDTCRNLASHDSGFISKVTTSRSLSQCEMTVITLEVMYY